jgi:putative heme-binding domain-containing protein
LAVYFDPDSRAADRVVRAFLVLGAKDAYPSDRSMAPILRARAVKNPRKARLDAFSTLAVCRNRPGEQRELLALISKIGGDIRTATALVDLWRTLAPEVAPQTIDALSSRKDWSNVLLDAVAAQKIPTAAVNANQIRRMMQFGDAALAQRVTAVWGKIREGRNPNRERLAAEYLNHVQRHSKGDPALGAKVYEKICAQCHQFKDKGVAVGPKLDDNGRTGLPLLVSNIMDPNLVIGKDYQARLLVLEDGRTLTGLVVEDSPSRVVLKLAGDKREIVPKANIERMKISDVSLMPEEVEKQMTKDEFRHLVAYLLAP